MSNIPLAGKLTSKVKERVYKPLLILCTCTVAITSFSNRYTFLPPVSDYPCIPGRLYIMDKYDHKINKGDLVTFHAQGVKLFPDGTLFTKISAGVGGDTVQVKRNMIINGDHVYHTDVSVTANHLKVSLDSLSREENIPKGKLFALGSLPGSYDSRFWGLVDIEKQVVGKSYVIF
ncbi:MULTISPECIES: signal peptidase I [unclassified Pseudoalteromonas]|uniref:signal peptidase I n=1 Tax=unclassified Pseudoalteromonas TaxID=194690 RepID=UPI0004248842|nr:MULTISPECIES: signal peptidase I [unclassified Pseudoalteromonas]